VGAVPDSLPAALFHHATVRPEEPWLFSREGWDWPWLPFRAVAGRVALWSTELAGLPVGCRAAFAAWPGPQPLALDLALQTAGLISIPLSADLSGPAFAAALDARGAEVWIEPGGSEPRELPAALSRWALSAWSEEGPSGLGGSRSPISPSPRLPAGSVVLEDGRELTAADLVAAARALDALLSPATSARRGREILVSFRPLADPAERPLLAWATWTGAALLLESDRATGPASAVWARPTLFRGDAHDLAVLRRAASGRRLRWPGRPRLPFGRLRTILMDGDLSREDRDFWEGRGVRLVEMLDFPSCSAPSAPLP
jgi:hypothetical protein